MELREARGEVASAVRRASPAIELISRLGHAAKGVVYLLLGGLALRAAFGDGHATDKQGALVEVLRAPYGRALLVALALGLFGFVVWRLVEVIVDPEGRKLAKRLVSLGSAGINAALAVSALRLSQGFAVRSSGDRQPQHWTGELLAAPAGRWLVGAVGLGLLIAAVHFVLKGVRSKFRKRLETYRMPAGHLRATLAVGRFGYVALGAMFAAVGFFVVRAALKGDAGQVHGMGYALRWLGTLPAGEWIFPLVAAGLFAHGLYFLAEARYRRIRLGG
jgi:hypothetical protein